MVSLWRAAKLSHGNALGKPDTGRPLQEKPDISSAPTRCAVNPRNSHRATHIPAEQMSEVAKTSRRLCGVFIASPICAAIGTMRTAAILPSGNEGERCRGEAGPNPDVRV